MAYDREPKDCRGHLFSELTLACIHCGITEREYAIKALRIEWVEPSTGSVDDEGEESNETQGGQL